MYTSKKSSVVVSLSISAEDYLKYYRGSAKNILARDVNGKTVNFPAGILQKFVTREGISGVFEIFFDSTGKFVSVERINVIRP
jgi:hypothetical protein